MSNYPKYFRTIFAIGTIWYSRFSLYYPYGTDIFLNMAIETTRQYNGRNFLVCFLVSLGAIAFAYPSAIIGVTLAQPSFLIYMGLVDITQSPPAATPNADGIIGAMSGVCIETKSWLLSLTKARFFKRVLCSMSSLLLGYPTNMEGKGHSNGLHLCHY